jgi:hypothetical protein
MYCINYRPTTRYVKETEAKRVKKPKTSKRVLAFNNVFSPGQVVMGIGALPPRQLMAGL